MISHGTLKRSVIEHRGARVNTEERAIESRAKALLAAQAAVDKQAQGVVVMDVQALSTVTDFFIICTADTHRQMAAIKDHVEATLLSHRCRVWHTEGTAQIGPMMGVAGLAPLWALMDCGDIVVHIFDRDSRMLYRLEELWADAHRVTIPGHVHPSLSDPRAPGAAPAPTRATKPCPASGGAPHSVSSHEPGSPSQAMAPPRGLRVWSLVGRVRGVPLTTRGEIA